MRIISTLAFSFLTIFSAAQVNIMWTSRYTSSGSNLDKAKAMVIDNSGNTYVTGVGFGATNFDYVTVKYNSSGTQQWVSYYNGPGDGLDEARAIAVDGSGNVYVTGWSAGTSNNYDYATVKYDASGAQQWVARYNGPASGSDEGNSIAVDGSGNVYVTGGSDGSGTGADYATLKYNSSGAQQWVTRYTFTGANVDQGLALKIDASGNVYVTGHSTGSGTRLDLTTLKYNNSGSQQWVKRYNNAGADESASAIEVDASGNIYVTGYTQVASTSTDFEIVTIKYDNSGNQQWLKTAAGTSSDYDRGNDIAVDGNGNVIVVGKMINAGTAEDFATISYDLNGNLNWIQNYDAGVVNYDEAKAVTLDAQSNIYVTGFSYKSPLGNDYLTIKYDTAGILQWLTKYNGPGNNSDQAAAIALDATENVYISGVSKGAGTNEDYATVKYCQLTANAGNDISICLGATTQLNASAPNAVSYSWTPSAGLSDTTIANPAANPTSTTNYVVAITNSNGCTDLDTIVVTVYPLPGPTISTTQPSGFCAGDSAVLTVNISPANYSWSNGDTTQSTAVFASGTYTVLVTDTNTCAAQSQITVTAFPLPNVDAGPVSTAICISDTTNLNATGAVTYSWGPSTGLSDTTIANPVAGPVLTTTYTVWGTDANGCVDSDSIEVIVNPNPPAPTITLTIGTFDVDLTGYNYQWYESPSNNPVPGETGPSFTPTANGDYYVTITDSIGCSSYSNTLTITNVGIGENTVSSFDIYPNPSEGQFTIDLSTIPGAEKLIIQNAIGQTISESFVSGGMKNIKVSIEENGIYFVSIISRDKKITSRVIIE